ncbi:MAG: flagellar hook assembly protein FlgD [Thioalkalispiraceae bacterium]|jgi:flagellar basal-body rod modification protein FlgD
MEGIDKSLPTFESLGLRKDKPVEQPRLKQEDFMKLMMAQMKHQDPTKPMENAEFITQMAQFSSVKGLKEIKDSFNTLANALQSSQALQASSMVGRKVLIPGDTTALAAEGIMRGGLEMPSPSESVRVKIFNKSGEQVHTIDLGERGKGNVQFKWDGVIAKANPEVPGSEDVVAPPGVYTVQAEAMIDGEPQSVKTFVVDKVASVSLAKDNKGVTLNLANAGATTLADIQEII